MIADLPLTRQNWHEEHFPAHPHERRRRAGQLPSAAIATPPIKSRRFRFRREPNSSAHENGGDGRPLEEYDELVDDSKPPT